jgi:hypothetical protein
MKEKDRKNERKKRIVNIWSKHFLMFRRKMVSFSIDEPLRSFTKKFMAMYCWSQFIEWGYFISKSDFSLVFCECQCLWYHNSLFIKRECNLSIWYDMNMFKSAKRTTFFWAVTLSHCFKFLVLKKMRMRFESLQSVLNSLFYSKF